MILYIKKSHFSHHRLFKISYVLWFIHHSLGIHVYGYETICFVWVFITVERSPMRSHETVPCKKIHTSVLFYRHRHDFKCSESYFNPGDPNMDSQQLWLMSGFKDKQHRHTQSFESCLTYCINSGHRHWKLWCLEAALLDWACSCGYVFFHACVLHLIIFGSQRQG